MVDRPKKQAPPEPPKDEYVWVKWRTRHAPPKPKDEYVWVKWRTRHAHGPSGWYYEEFERSADADPGKWLDKKVEWLAYEHNTGSEMYRGADAEYEVPPKEWAEKQIGYVKFSLKVQYERLQRLEALLEAQP